MKEASAEPIRAPLRAALLEAGAHHLLHPTPGKGGILVELSEVPGRGVYLEGHASTSCGVAWKHWLLRCAFNSKCGLLPYSPHPGVSGALMIRSMCVEVHCTVFVWGLLLPSRFLSSCQHSERGRRQIGLYSISTLLAYQRPGVEPRSGALLVTLLVCHQSHIFIQGPLGLSERLYAWVTSSSKSMLSTSCHCNSRH